MKDKEWCKGNNKPRAHTHHQHLWPKQSVSKYIKQQMTELQGETNKLIIVAKILPKPQKQIYQENKKWAEISGLWTIQLISVSSYVHVGFQTFPLNTPQKMCSQIENRCSFKALMEQAWGPHEMLVGNWTLLPFGEQVLRIQSCWVSTHLVAQKFLARV